MTSSFPPAGTITLAATPIGDPGDATPKLRQALEKAQLIAAEDTRRLLQLARRMELTVTGKLVSLHEHNEDARAQALIAQAQAGAAIVVVSDAGMPTVSDPGYRLVQAAVAAGVPVTAVPGPSAVLTALAVSGLASDRFCFEGFLPRKPGELARALENLAAEERTLIFFESPRRIHRAMTALAEAFGKDRPAAICRELTKTHEEILRGTLAELVAATTEGLLGEITIVVAGAAPRPSDPAAQLAAVQERLAAGQRLKDAVAEVAAQTGARKNELYRAALAARQVL